MIGRKWQLFLLGPLMAGPPAMCRAQAPATLTVDASVTRPIETSSFQGGTARSPAGHVLGMNARYLTLDSKPWLPTMGEFHYSRVPAEQWEQQILKMKAAGVEVVSTYIFWIHHEEVEGQFDWTGDRDLRRFIELCAKHGMYVYLRIGPWNHGEVRHGGFPDWLLRRTEKTRTNDPVYLQAVDELYRQSAAQVKGLMWKDGGPIIGIQLENEYARRGTDAGEAHILELKKMAVADGFDVPLYSVTGWDRAVIPKSALVAVFGGYPDAPWDESISQLPPAEVYAFRFGSRVTGDMGMMGAGNKTTAPDAYDFPFMTAEMGGGNEVTYHRRPVIEPDDIMATMPVMLGSGVNLYGWYMFQGGVNPEGKLTTLQESQATGYPNDVPVKDYDFQAPLSAYGEERPLLQQLKIYNYFLRAFGEILAPMEPHIPSVTPTGPADLSVPRVSVRSQGDSGFLFFNNYVRDTEMPSRPGFQVSVKLATKTVSIPQRPITLPSGSYGIWPIEMKMGSSVLRYATAQPVTVLSVHGRRVYCFVETKGVAPEFVWDEASVAQINSPTGGAIERQHGTVTVRGLRPSLQPGISLTMSAGERIDIVLLSETEAEHAWIPDLRHPQQLVVTPTQFYADEQGIMLQTNDPDFTFHIMPVSSPLHTKGLKLIGRDRFSASYRVSLMSQSPSVKVASISSASIVPPVHFGPQVSGHKRNVAQAPDDAEFRDAARWRIELSKNDWNGISDLFLTIRYDGDVARLTSGGRLLDDNFYNGVPWRVGLQRYRKQIAEHGLELEILPRRRDAPVYLQRNGAEDHWVDGQVCESEGVSITPEYTVRIPFDAAANAKPGTESH